MAMSYEVGDSLIHLRWWWDSLNELALRDGLALLDGDDIHSLRRWCLAIMISSPTAIHDDKFTLDGWYSKSEELMIWYDTCIVCLYRCNFDDSLCLLYIGTIYLVNSLTHTESYDMYLVSIDTNIYAPVYPWIISRIQ
jgi:hypothetical protein